MDYEHRILELEKRIEEQEKMIKHLYRILGFVRNVHVFTEKPDAERIRPHSGGVVSGNVTLERTRPWGQGNT